MGDTGWITGGILMTIFLAIIFSGYAYYNVELGITCHELDIDSLTGNGTALDIFSQFNLSLALFLSPCSGLPWWLYVLIFLPLVIGIAVWLIPFVGG